MPNELLIARISLIVRRSRERLGVNAPEGMVNMDIRLGRGRRCGHWPCGQSYECDRGPRGRPFVPPGRRTGEWGGVREPVWGRGAPHRYCVPAAASLSIAARVRCKGRRHLRGAHPQRITARRGQRSVGGPWHMSSRRGVRHVETNLDAERALDCAHLTHRPAKPGEAGSECAGGNGEHGHQARSRPPVRSLALWPKLRVQTRDRWPTIRGPEDLRTPRIRT